MCGFSQIPTKANPLRQLSCPYGSFAHCLELSKVHLRSSICSAWKLQAHSEEDLTPTGTRGLGLCQITPEGLHPLPLYMHNFFPLAAPNLTLLLPACLLVKSLPSSVNHFTSQMSDLILTRSWGFRDLQVNKDLNVQYKQSEKSTLYGKPFEPCYVLMQMHRAEAHFFPCGPPLKEMVTCRMCLI